MKIDFLSLATTLNVLNKNVLNIIKIWSANYYNQTYVL